MPRGGKGEHGHHESGGHDEDPVAAEVGEAGRKLDALVIHERLGNGNRGNAYDLDTLAHSGRHRREIDAGNEPQNVLRKQ